MTGTEAALAHEDLATVPVTWQTLDTLCRTEFVPREYRNRPAAALGAVLMGRELGLGPMEALSKINVIDGRPTLSAELLGALVRRAGHRLSYTQLTDTAATVVGERIDNGQVVESLEFTFTIDQASRAGLTGKANWRQYPELMLAWRATTAVCRLLFADVITATSAYTPDELGSEAWEPPAIDAEVNAGTVTGPRHGGVSVVDDGPAMEPDAVRRSEAESVRSAVSAIDRASVALKQRVHELAGDDPSAATELWTAVVADAGADPYTSPRSLSEAQRISDAIAEREHRDTTADDAEYAALLNEAKHRILELCDNNRDAAAALWEGCCIDSALNGDPENRDDLTRVLATLTQRDASTPEDGIANILAIHDAARRDNRGDT